MSERRFRLCVLDTDIEDDVVGANRSRREQRAVDHQVRPGRHQRAILETQRLALRAVRARQATAATTLPMHAASIASIHAKRGSVPVPMPWITATGHIK